MAIKRFLAFDVGSENGRAVAGLIEGGRLVIDELLSFKNSVLRIGKQRKWNVYSYFEQLITALKLYAGKYGPDLDAIGVDSWGFDFGMIDERGQLISLPNNPADIDLSLSDGILDEMLGNRRIYEITGVPVRKNCTLQQLVDLARRGDICVRGGKRLLFISDILNYFLTDSGACELTMARSSGLIDMSENVWSGEIFDVFEIPDTLMSDIVAPGTRIGYLTDELTAITGLNPGTPVIAPASLSAVSASIALPLSDGAVAFLNSGAQAVCGLETGRPVLNGLAYDLSLVNMPSVCGHNLLLKQSNGLALIGRCKAEWKLKNAAITYEDIMDEAKYAPPFSGVIDVDDPMFDNLYSTPSMVASFVERTGQPAIDPEDKGVVARIIYESLAFKYRYAFDQLRKASFLRFDTLHIVGGGARAELLNQFCANALGVKVMAGPVEATSVGNILVAAGSLGLFDSIDAMRKCVSDSFDVKVYAPVNTDQWNERYERFIDICALRPR